MPPVALRAALRTSRTNEISRDVAPGVEVEALRNDRCQPIAHRLGAFTQPLGDAGLGAEEPSLQHRELCFLRIEQGSLHERLADRGERGLEPGASCHLVAHGAVPASSARGQQIRLASGSAGRTFGWTTRRHGRSARSVTAS